MTDIDKSKEIGVKNSKIIKALMFIHNSRKNNNLWRMDTEELANKIENILEDDRK